MAIPQRFLLIRLYLPIEIALERCNPDGQHPAPKQKTVVAPLLSRRKNFGLYSREESKGTFNKSPQNRLG